MPEVIGRGIGILLCNYFIFAHIQKSMETNITKYFIRHGLIYAILSVFLTMVLYLAGADFFANHMFVIGGLFLLIALAYPIIIVIQYRKMNGNSLSFKDGFQVTFFTLSIAGLI